MDGSLIADVANAVASFANVAATVILGVLVYKFSKRDEAGRIERALENDRNLRAEEWVRERRVRAVSPILDSLVALPGQLLNLASFATNPGLRRNAAETSGRITETLNTLAAAVPALTSSGLREECIKLVVETTQVMADVSTYVLNDRDAMPSWLDAMTEQNRFLTGKANRLAHEVSTWQDGGDFTPIDWQSNRPARLGPPVYPSLEG